MIVVDASVVVTALLSSSSSGALARETLLRDGDLHAPHLLHVEALSALRRRTHSGLLEATHASAAVAALGALDVTGYAHTPLLSRAWQLRDSVTAYDAMYVALAEALGCSLVTADRPLSRAPGLRCPITLLED